MEEKKAIRQQPVCNCGTTSVHKVFASFEYDYCSVCKKEVEETEIEWNPFFDESNSLINNHVQLAYQAAFGSPANQSAHTGAGLPAGYVALKGEDITCGKCGGYLGFLKQDLPVFNAANPRGQVVDWSVMGITCIYCNNQNPGCRIAGNSFYYHVRNRGWV